MKIEIDPFIAKKILKIIKKNSGLTNDDVSYIDELTNEIAVEMLTKLVNLQLLTEV
jgi:hypothetical protein